MLAKTLTDILSNTTGIYSYKSIIQIIKLGKESVSFLNNLPLIAILLLVFIIVMLLIYIISEFKSASN